MLDAIEGAIYYDAVFGEHFEVLEITDTDDGPIVVLSYKSSQVTATVDLVRFKQTEDITLEHLPAEQDASE